MIKRLYEKYKIILVYTLLAMIIGVIVGIIDVIFGRVLLAIGEFREGHNLYLIPFLPIAGIVIVLLYQRLSKESIKGMTLVFETGHGDRDKIPKMLVPLVILSTWITHLFGGSAGREGVAVQLGATVSHNIGEKLKIKDEGKILIAVGMAAGFAGLFQTPLAATFFAIEVLVAGSMMYQALLPSLVGAYVASYTSSFLGLEKFSVEIKNSVEFSIPFLGKLILLGVIFGITGGGFAYGLGFAKKFFSKIIDNPIKKIIIMGSVLAIVFLLFHMGRYSGLGSNLINASFSGGNVYMYDWILKFLLTILTLSAGYQGGELTPLFSIGAALGVVLASLFGLPVMFVAALGYIAVFGSATNTLIAPILIGAEVFGGEHIISFAVVCAIAYVFNGNISIYGAQKQKEHSVNEKISKNKIKN